ncbi:MAG TPA: hypothetical protein PK593_07645 [Thermomicrobiales bacterium]|jgi:uncharacterized lipoprotein|nr:hypothetical protein [Chloroflexota bacterium]HQX63317.1 hypothetical protein [Thermomicrobiales bacterium]HBY45213.1 hypothetical protein [Chloroflexota bacterium]HCG29104.1 hypothetical protein [Chloroflexota bacterium]HQZ91238.1 hypothetical protein [Thermomicrobiales bacterium]
MNGETRRTLRLLLSVVSLLLAGLVAACGSVSDQTRPTSNPTSHATQPASSPAAPKEPGGATPVVDDASWKKVREEGTVMVIVTLNIPYRPEAELGSQREIDAQRAAIVAAQDQLIASLTAGHAEVNTRMTLFPQIVLTVDEPALRQLADSPLVTSVQENKLSAPTSRVTRDRTSV